MNKVPGLLKTEDVEQLSELVQGKGVLQLGCYCGRGTLVLAQYARRTWVLEDFSGYLGGFAGVVEELKANIDRTAPFDAELNLLYGTAAGWSIPDGSIDLEPAEVEVVYRDANRVGSLGLEDEQLAYALLKRVGGVYAWHDKEHELRWLRIDPLPVEVN